MTAGRAQHAHEVRPRLVPQRVLLHRRLVGVRHGVLACSPLCQKTRKLHGSCGAALSGGSCRDNASSSAVRGVATVHRLPKHAQNCRGPEFTCSLV